MAWTWILYVKIVKDVDTTSIMKHPIMFEKKKKDRDMVHQCQLKIIVNLRHMHVRRLG